MIVSRRLTNLHSFPNKFNKQKQFFVIKKETSGRQQLDSLSPTSPELLRQLGGRHHPNNQCGWSLALLRYNAIPAQSSFDLPVFWIRFSLNLSIRVSIFWKQIAALVFKPVKVPRIKQKNPDDHRVQTKTKIWNWWTFAEFSQMVPILVLL